MDQRPDARLEAETIDYIALRRLQNRYADVVTRRAWPELATLFLPDAKVVIDRRNVEPLVRSTTSISSSSSSSTP
jgi:hypothetical protein